MLCLPLSEELLLAAAPRLFHVRAPPLLRLGLLEPPPLDLVVLFNLALERRLLDAGVRCKLPVESIETTA